MGITPVGPTATGIKLMDLMIWWSVLWCTWCMINVFMVRPVYRFLLVTFTVHIGHCAKYYNWKHGNKCLTCPSYSKHDSLFFQHDKLICMHDKFSFTTNYFFGVTNYFRNLSFYTPFAWPIRISHTVYVHIKL